MNSLAPDSVLDKDKPERPDTSDTMAAEIDFDAAAREHRPYLMRIAVASTRNVHDAEDVVQEALLRGYRGLDRFRGDCPLRVWLARIVVRVAINHRRSFVRTLKRWMLFGDLERQDGSGKPIPFDPADPSGDFDREAMLDVEKHIQELPDAFRVPLLMLAAEGLTIPEIAGILEIPEGTVKSRIFYGRKRLKRSLKK